MSGRLKRDRVPRTRRPAGLDRTLTAGAYSCTRPRATHEEHRSAFLPKPQVESQTPELFLKRPRLAAFASCEVSDSLA